MRAALISLVDPDTAGPGGAPIGLAPLADGTLAMLQIDLASRFGAEELIVLVDAVPPALGAIERYAEALGLRVWMARGLADISVRLGGEDLLLVIAEGLCLRADLAAALFEERGPFVAAMVRSEQGGADAEPAQRFEPIDINHRWVGLAAVRGADLVALRGMPGDWSVPSAALRMAVQKGYPRRIVSTALIEQDRLGLMQSPADTTRFEQAWLTDAGLGQPLVRPVERSVRALWRSASARLALGGIGIAAPWLAVVAAALGWIGPGLVLLVLGMLADSIDRKLMRFFLGHRRGTGLALALDAGFAAAILALVAASAGPGQPWTGGFAGLVWLGLAWLVEHEPQASDRPRTALAPRWAYLVGACVAAPFGALLGWTMLAGLALLGWLVWSRDQNDKLAPTAPRG